MQEHTQQLIYRIATGLYPTDATRVAFGITSPEHFEALGKAVRTGRITPLGLDRMLGKGAEITKAVGVEGLTFDTGWHELFTEMRADYAAARQRDGLDI